MEALGISQKPARSLSEIFPSLLTHYYKALGTNSSNVMEKMGIMNVFRKQLSDPLSANHRQQTIVTAVIFLKRKLSTAHPFKAKHLLLGGSHYGNHLKHNGGQLLLLFHHRPKLVEGRVSGMCDAASSCFSSYQLGTDPCNFKLPVFNGCITMETGSLSFGSLEDAVQTIKT